MAFRRAPLRSSSQAPRHPSGMPARASTQGWSQRGPLSLPWQRGGGQPRRTGARKLKLSKKKQVRMEKTCNEAGSVRATGVKNVPPRQKYFFFGGRYLLQYTTYVKTEGRHTQGEKREASEGGRPTRLATSESRNTPARSHARRVITKVQGGEMRAKNVARGFALVSLQITIVNVT